MLTILTSIVTVLSVVVFLGAIWLAVWAWRSFQVSIFAWLVIERALGSAVGLLTLTPDPAKIKAALTTLSTQGNLDVADMFLVTSNLTALFPLLAKLGFIMIALGEISHFGSRIEPTYVPHRSLIVLYRLRHLFGVFAVTCTVAPSLALVGWLRSMA